MSLVRDLDADDATSLRDNFKRDWRAATVGGFKTGLFPWQACCLPSLLYNAGSWVDMSAEAVKKGEALQTWYLRLLL